MQKTLLRFFKYQCKGDRWFKKKKFICASIIFLEIKQDSWRSEEGVEGGHVIPIFV